MDQLTQRTYIETVGVYRVETVQSEAAQRASPGFIERKAVQKWRAAAGAEIFGGKRRGLAEAALADGDTGNFLEGLAADAAIIGKEQLPRQTVSETCCAGPS